MQQALGFNMHWQVKTTTMICLWYFLYCGGLESNSPYYELCLYMLSDQVTFNSFIIFKEIIIKYSLLFLISYGIMDSFYLHCHNWKNFYWNAVEFIKATPRTGLDQTFIDVAYGLQGVKHKFKVCHLLSF